VLCAKIEYMAGVYAHFNPTVVGLGIARSVLVALKAGEIQSVLVYAKPLFARKQFVAPLDGFMLKVVAEAPVAEHFKECAVAGIANLVYIAGAQALLYVCKAAARGMLLAHKIGHEGMHAGRCKQNGRIVFGYKGGGRNNLVAPFLKELQVKRPELIGSKVFHYVYLLKCLQF
jgi:hypothetical protein